MKNEKFPKTVTVGSVSVKLYRTPTKGSDSFTVVYYDADRHQHRRTFSDPVTAEQEAQVIAAQLARGEQRPCVVGVCARQASSYAKRWVARHDRRGNLIFIDGHAAASSINDVVDTTAGANFGKAKFPQADIVWTADPGLDPNL